MQIKRDCVVAIDYTLTDDAGKLLQQTQGGPLHYLHGHRNIVPGLEKTLQGKSVGDDFEVSLPPEDGYGRHNEKLLLDVPMGELPQGVRPQKGSRFQMRFGERVRPVVIAKVRLKDVQVDANHELVDRTLHFKGKVRAVRAATRSEIAHGHVHLAGHHR